MIQEQSCDPTVFFAAYEHAKTISAQDAAHVGAKTATDMMLLHGATKVVSAIAKQSVSAFLSCMRKGAQSADVAITAEGVPVRCAEEVSSLMSNVEQVGGAAESGFVLERRVFSATEKICFVEIKNPVLDNIRTGSALKPDSHHAFHDIVDNFVQQAEKFIIKSGDPIIRELYQIEGSLNGQQGIFEWIVDPRPNYGVTHRMFIKNGKITGRPNIFARN
jgi:hypothetical protein